ncbi:MAG: RNA polymerase sigma factor RpoS, partial [Chromatiales bacterium]|nr:RNA polymerase sigma factor RpoS [Chromatiales bacterium]
MSSEDDSGAQEEERDLEDAGVEDAATVDEVELEEAVIFSAGAIPEGQLDATRLYLNEIGFS